MLELINESNYYIFNENYIESQIENPSWGLSICQIFNKGSALMKEILHRALNNHIHLIFSEVSITAKPFFEKWGFRIVTQQTIIRKGIELTNFKMERTV